MRFGCRPRHDGMNFEHLQISSGHAHQPFSVLCHRPSSFSTSLRPSSTATRATLCAWNLRGATSGTLSMSAFGSAGPPPPLDAVTAFTSFFRRNLLPRCCPESIRLRSIPHVFHMINTIHCTDTKTTEQRQPFTSGGEAAFVGYRKPVALMASLLPCRISSVCAVFAF